MKIIVRKANKVTVLDLIGPLVWEQPVEAFREQIRHLLAAGTKSLAINLAQVPNLDSSGQGALFAAHKSIQEAGAKCKFFAASEQVLHILKRIRLDEVFELFEDEASAVSSFGLDMQ